jgi:hypothetical protein
VKEMEVVQQHPLQDIYRIEAGVILKVNKHKKGNWVSLNFTPKTDIKRAKGLAGGIEAIRSIHGGRREVLPPGTIILDHFAVEPVTDPNEYTFELKFSGGAMSGTIADYIKFNEVVAKQLDSYF